VALKITKFRIELHRTTESGSRRWSASEFTPVTYEAVQEAKRIYCLWLDSLLDDRTFEERLASLDRYVRGEHAVQNIIEGGNNG
jgi:hypothetical protein